MITQTLDLNLIPGRVLPLVNVSQYDKDSRTLEFTIYNGDQTFDLTGLSAYIQGLKPDGHGFNYSANISAGKITADITEQMTAVSGRVMCEIIIMSGADRIGTGNFILNVEAAAMPDGSNMSASEYSYVQELLEEAQEIVDGAEQYVEDAEAWANGTRDGQAIPATDPAYNKNSKYWSEQSSDYSEDAEAWANGTRDGQTIPSTDPAYHKNSKYWSEQSASYVEDAEAWAVGTRNGTPVPSGSPEYENNAAYWANEARNVAQQTTYTEQDDSFALAPTSAGNALPLTIYGQSTQNGTPTPSAPVAIESASADFKCVGKNLIPFPYDDGYVERNGINWVFNEDGTVIAKNGTASPADSNYYLSLAPRPVMRAGTYVISGVPTGYNNKIFMRVRNYTDPDNVTTVATDYGNGVTFTLNSDAPIGVYISILKDTVVSSPITFKPMIRLASTTDATYKPYEKTNIKTYTSGANQLPSPYYDGASKTTQGATFTVESDGSITITGQPSDTAFFNLTPVETTNQYAGMTLSGGYSPYCRLRARVTDANNTFVGEYVDNGYGVVVESIQDGYKIQFQVIASKSSAPINFKVYPSVQQITLEPLRAIEVTSSDDYNIVKDGHYYIADTIDWDEVDGYTLTKRVGEVTLTSAEGIVTSSGNDSPTSKCYRWQKAVFVNDTPATRLVPIYSNRFVDGVTADGVKALGKCLGRTPAGYKNLQVYVSLDTSITTTQAAGDWLDANETKVQYILDVPVKTSLTSAQAKALLSMRTYDESTSIDAVNAPAPVLELEYAKTRTPALALTGHNMAHINAIDIGDM